MALKVGEIPKGMCVCHHCDNPPCCNSDHLFIGTQADNMGDCKKKGRNSWVSRPGETNNLAKLSEKDVKMIRHLCGSKTYTSIALRYGVTRQNISHIDKRKTWKHI